MYNNNNLHCKIVIYNENIFFNLLVNLFKIFQKIITLCIYHNFYRRIVTAANKRQWPCSAEKVALQLL